MECAKEQPSIAILAISKDITIESGSVTAKASLFGIASLKDGNASLEGGNVIINGGTVNAEGIVGIIGNMVEINGGTVTATGENTVYGIGGNEITISGNKTSVTAAGTEAAIRGKVINLIDGVGWRNTAGTAGRTDIAINAGGRELENYKKVRFPKILGPAAVTTNPAAKSLTYTGSAQALVTDGTASGGTILYALGTSAVNAPTTGWSTSIPARTEAGTYHVWYMVKGDEDHSDTKPVHIEVTIGAAPVPPDTPTAESADIVMNSSFRLSWRGRKVKAAWGSAPGADSYEVWAAYCGTSTFEKVCTVQGKNKASIKRLKGKQLSRKRCVKAYVVAMRAGTEIGRTFIGHTAGPENWHTNAKKVSISKRAYNLSVGQTDKIQAKIVKVKKGHKLLHGKALVYASSNPAVAAVSSDGQISAVGAGNCDVWVYALNGKHQKLTVTVQ